jgi:two-component system, NtrC family, sensor kinase
MARINKKGLNTSGENIPVTTSDAEKIEFKCAEIFNNVNNCIVLYHAVDNGHDFIIADFNSAAEKTEKITREEVINRRVTDVFPGVAEFGLLDVFRRVWQTGISEHHPITQYKDRRITGWRENFIFRLSSGDIVAVYDDVSERKKQEQEVLLKDEQYRLLVENSSDAILLTAPDGRVFSANPTACRMLGYSEEEICKLGREGIIDSNDPKLAKALEERGRTGKVKVELTFIRKDGSRLIGEVSSVVYTDSAGEIRTSMIIRDITEQLKSQEAVKLSEERYRTLVTACPDGIVTVTTDGIITFASDQAYKLFNNPDKDEVTGQSMLKWVAPKSRELMVVSLASTLKQEKTIRHEYPVVDKEGKEFWVETNSTPVKDKLGNISGLLVVLRDVTDRIQVELALKKEREFLDSIIENTPNAMWISDGEGTVIRINQALRDLLNVTDEEILGKYSVLKDSQVIDQGFSILVKSVFEEGRTVNFPLDYYTEKESQVKLQQSQHLILDVMISAITNSDGQVINAICQLKDITDPVLAEQSLIKERENFRNSLEMSPLGAQIISVQGELLHVNQTLLNLWGYSSTKELQQVPRIKRFTEESISLADKLYEKRRQGEIPSNYEIELLDKDGKHHNMYTYSNNITWDGQPAIQILYEDITERKRMEQVLKKNEQRLRDAQKAGRISDWEFDVTTQKISWSDEMFELFERDKNIGSPTVKEDANYYSPEETIKIKKYAQHTLNTSQSTQYDVEVHLPSGKVKFFNNTLYATKDQNGQVVKLSGTVQDITDRKQAEKAVILERENFRNSLDTSPLGIEILNTKAELVYTNQTILDMWGYASLEQLKKVPVKHAFSLTSADMVRKMFRERKIGIAPPSHELTIICADGQLKDVRVYSKETNWNGETCIQLLFEDITERKKMEMGIHNLNETLKLIRNINQLIVKIDNESELLQKGCEELVSSGHYLLAWIGFMQSGSYDVLPVASAGGQTEYISKIKETWDDSPNGSGPSGLTIKTGRPYVFRNLSTDFRFESWREEALQREFRSTIALPLTVQNKVIGVLNIFSNNTDSFHEQQLELFIELAQDISLGIEKIRQRKERQKVEQVLENEAIRRRILIDQSHDGIVLLDHEGRVYDTNQRFAEMIGYSQEETRSLNVWDWEYLHSPEVTLGMIRNVDEKGHHFESKHKRKDGSIYDVEISSNAAVFEGKKLIFCVCRDISERKKTEEDLLSRALLLDASTDSIILYDLEGNIIFANEALLRSHGTTREQITHMDILDQTVVSPDRWQTRIYGIDKKPYLSYELQRTDIYGNIRDVEVRAQLVLIGTKKLVLSIARDITDRKKTEAILKDRERQYRELAESISDVFFAMNKNMQFTYWNLTSELFTGIAAKDVIGKGFIEIFGDSTTSQEMHHFFAKSLAVGQPQHFTTKNPIQEHITQDISVYPSNEGISVFARDITRQEEIREELIESEERLRILFEDAPDAYFMCDPEGRIIDGNRAAVKMTGYDRREFIGKSFYDLHLLPSSEDENKLKSLLKENTDGYPSGNNELQLLQKNETKIDVEISSYPTRVGKQILVLAIVRDITERKKIQENLIVTDRLASIGELASGMAHELNNPLTTVIGIADILLEQQLPEDIKEDIIFMSKEARRTAEVAKNMLTFARKHPIVKSMVNINEIISKVLEIRTYEQKVNNIEVIRKLAEKLPDIYADQFKLQQVFLNIVINAEYFMKEANNGGTLNIKTEQVGSMVKISITDNGPGISKENINHIFDPFYTTKPVGKGTGLGLSICHGIISEHNGRIYAESEPGKGTNFIIEIPINSQLTNNTSIASS